MVWQRILDAIGSPLAFYPPSPPSYRLANHGDGAREQFFEPVASGLRKVARAEVLHLPTGRRTKGEEELICCAFVPAPGGRDAVRWTILHSHGNAVDLGELLPLYDELSRLLNVNICGWDYRAYGASGGAKPTVSSALADVAVVYRALQERYGRRPEEIVLYGQSVGSGPTCHLAAALGSQAAPAGIVLHSPFLSGMKVLNPTWKWPAFADIFPNARAVPKIACPALVMHGTQDEVIDVAHGRALAALCAKPSEPLWAEGCGHNNLESCPGYVPRLRAFLAEVFGEGYGGRRKAGGGGGGGGGPSARG